MDIIIVTPVLEQLWYLLGNLIARSSHGMGIIIRKHIRVAKLMNEHRAHFTGRQTCGETWSPRLRSSIHHCPCSGPFNWLGLALRSSHVSPPLVLTNTFVDEIWVIEWDLGFEPCSKLWKICRGSTSRVPTLHVSVWCTFSWLTYHCHRSKV